MNKGIDCLSYINITWFSIVVLLIHILSHILSLFLGNAVLNWRLQHHLWLLIMVQTKLNDVLCINSLKHSCIWKWQLCMKMTAIYENDSYIQKWQMYTKMMAKMTSVYENESWLYENESYIQKWQMYTKMMAKMTSVYENESCIRKWELYSKMTDVYENDSENESCIWKWHLYMKMIAVYKNDSYIWKW